MLIRWPERSEAEEVFPESAAPGTHSRPGGTHNQPAPTALATARAEQDRELDTSIDRDLRMAPRLSLLRTGQLHPRVPLLWMQTPQAQGSLIAGPTPMAGVCCDLSGLSRCWHPSALAHNPWAAAGTTNTQGPMSHSHTPMA